jgi:hypothetical protein
MKKGQVRKDITLWESDVLWFEDTYRGMPLSTALAWMLQEFKRLHGPTTPRAFMEAAVEAFKDTLQDRRKEPRDE